jgi:hypothetical protein
MAYTPHHKRMLYKSVLECFPHATIISKTSQIQAAAGGMTNHVAIGALRICFVAFLGRTRRKSYMLVVRGRVEMEIRMGAGVLKEVNLSANAVGLKSFGFLDFGLECGSAKKNMVLTCCRSQGGIGRLVSGCE